MAHHFFNAFGQALSGLSFDDPKNEKLYQIMGCNKTANAKELRKAYKRKAAELHPDKHPKETKKYTV